MKKFALFIILIGTSALSHATTLNDMKMGMTTLDDIPGDKNSYIAITGIEGFATGDLFKDSAEDRHIRTMSNSLLSALGNIVLYGNNGHLLQALVDAYRKLLQNANSKNLNLYSETSIRQFTNYIDEVYGSELDVIFEKGTKYNNLDRQIRTSFLSDTNKTELANRGFTQIPNWTLYMAALFAIYHELPLKTFYNLPMPAVDDVKRADYVKMTILRHFHRLMGDTSQKGFNYLLVNWTSFKFGEKYHRDYTVGLKITDLSTFMQTFADLMTPMVPIIFGNTQYQNAEVLKKDVSGFLQDSCDLLMDLAFQPKVPLPANYADSFIATLPGISYAETTPPATQAVVNTPPPQDTQPAVDYAQFIAFSTKNKNDADQKQADATTAGNTAKADLYAKASVAWKNATDSANKAIQVKTTLSQLAGSSDQQLFMKTQGELNTHNAALSTYIQEAVKAQNTAAETVASTIEADADDRNKKGYTSFSQMTFLSRASGAMNNDDSIFYNEYQALRHTDYWGNFQDDWRHQNKLPPYTIIFYILGTHILQNDKLSAIDKKRLGGIVKAFLWAGFGLNMGESGVAEDSAKPSGLKIADPTKFFTKAAGYFAQMMHDLYPAKPFETNIPKGFSLLIAQYHNLLSQQLTDGATQLPLLIELCKLYEEYVPTFLGRPLKWENMATIFGAGSTDIVNIYNMLNEAYVENSEPVKRATLLGNLAYWIPFKDFKYMPNPTLTDLIQNLILAEQKYRPENFVNNIADFLGYYFMPNLQFVKGYDDNAQMQHTQDRYVTVAYDPAITLLADLLTGIEGLDANLKSQIAGLSQKVLMTNPNITNLNKMRGAVSAANAEKEATARAAGQAQLQAPQQAANTPTQAQGTATFAANAAQTQPKEKEATARAAEQAQLQAQQQAATAQLQARGVAQDAATRAQNEAEIRAPSDPVRNRQKGRQGKNRYNKN